MRFRPTLLLSSVAVLLTACDQPVTAPEASVPVSGITALPSPLSQAAPNAILGEEVTWQGLDVRTLASGSGDLQAFLAATNLELAAMGAGVAIEKAEWFGLASDVNEIRVVFANDRTLRLPSHWIPGDPRRGGAGLDLTQASFPFFQLATGVASSDLIPTEGIVDAAFGTWNALQCSPMKTRKVAVAPGVFPSAILSVPGLVNDPFAADIATIGWLPGAIFELIGGPGFRENVLGVTFTFSFVDENGNPTDIDRDRRTDTALAEIWYNDDFQWAVADLGPFDPRIDVESVVLHEVGHALSMDHFGRLTLHVTRGGVRVQASPRAVMNASYIGTLRDPLGTDVATHCSNFANWM